MPVSEDGPPIEKLARKVKLEQPGNTALLRPVQRALTSRIIQIERSRSQVSLTQTTSYGCHHTCPLRPQRTKGVCSPTAFWPFLIWPSAPSGTTRATQVRLLSLLLQRPCLYLSPSRTHAVRRSQPTLLQRYPHARPPARGAACPRKLHSPIRGPDLGQCGWLRGHAPGKE